MNAWCAHALFTYVEERILYWQYNQVNIILYSFGHTSAFVHKSDVESRAKERPGVPHKGLKWVLHVSVWECTCVNTHIHTGADRWPWCTRCWGRGDALLGTVPQHPCVYVRAGTGAGGGDVPGLHSFIFDLGKNFTSISNLLFSREMATRGKGEDWWSLLLKRKRKNLNYRLLVF